MAAEVAPEVKAKEHEEAKKKEEARLERAKLMAVRSSCNRSISCSSVLRFSACC